MKNNKNRILSLLCALALLLGSTFTNISFAEEKDELTTTTEETKSVEETKPTEATKPVEETKSTEATKSVEETKSTKATKPVEETKSTEATTPVGETKEKANVTDSGGRELRFIVYARNEKGEESIYREFTRYGMVNKKISIPIKEMFKDIISVEGGDFKLEGDNLVGTVDNIDVNIIIKDNDYVPSTNKIILYLLTMEDYVMFHFVTVYLEPGSVIPYTPDKIDGYVYTGPSVLIAPTTDRLNLEYKKFTFPINVSFVDTDGNKIAQSTSIYGKVYEKHIFELPSIQGYTFKNASSEKNNISNNDGVLMYSFYSEYDNVELIYSKDETTTTPTTPVTPPTAVTPTITTKVVTTTTKDKTTATKTSNKKVLPKTGSAKTYTTVAGIALLAAGFAVVGKKKKA